MLRRQSLWLQTRRPGFVGSMLDKAEQFVKRNVPDPRKDPNFEKPVGYEDFRSPPQLKKKDDPSDETLEEYMKKRNEGWIKANQIYGGLGDLHEKLGMPAPKSGTLSKVPRNREQYLTPETMETALVEQNAKQLEIDEEALKLRRELQMQNEAEYRKFVAEAKRQELTEQRESRRRLPHPADPKYDPFKQTPGYRPQDSSKLADWLQKQRATGKTASGLSLSTREGMDRWYNEEKMATQDYANPFATRIEVPRGAPRLDLGAMSPDSFFIDGKEVIGSVIMTPTRYYHWNVKNFEDITEESLTLLLHLYPVPDVVFIGTGRNQRILPHELRIAFQKRGTCIYEMPTREAGSQYSLQLSMKRRVACAMIACVPTNPYGTECFGDFIDNDHWILSDHQLGIPAVEQHMPELYRPNVVAEKYRHMQGTGYGPKYRQLTDGRLVRGGRHFTKLHPMIEPGEKIDWENLPSYYHWFPKEQVYEYIENNTYRETKDPEGTFEVNNTEKRVRTQQYEGSRMQAEGEQPVAELMPWDSRSIPVPAWAGERGPKYNPELRGAVDPKTGRAIEMHKGTFEVWKEMMRARRDGREPEKEVEYDQEVLTTDNKGMLWDSSNVKYRPHMYGSYDRRKRIHSGGRGFVPGTFQV